MMSFEAFISLWSHVHEHENKIVKKSKILVSKVEQIFFNPLIRGCSCVYVLSEILFENFLQYGPMLTKTEKNH